MICGLHPLLLVLHIYFFADDNIIFARATVKEVATISSILTFYEESSEQQVNFDKTQLLTSRKVPTHRTNELAGLLGVKAIERF